MGSRRWFSSLLLASSLSLVLSSFGAGAAERCPKGQVPDPKGFCRPAPTCKAGQELINGKCFDKCPDGSTVNGEGKCACASGTRVGPNGACKPAPACKPGQDAVLGKCFDKCPDGSTVNNQGKCPCAAGRRIGVDGGCRTPLKKKK